MLLYFLPCELLMKVIGFWWVELHPEKQPVRGSVWKRTGGRIELGLITVKTLCSYAKKKKAWLKWDFHQETDVYTEAEERKKKKKKGKKIQNPRPH